MAYVTPDAWSVYDAVKKKWSSWNSTFFESAYLWPKGGGREQPSRLCIRFKADKNIVSKVNGFYYSTNVNLQYNANLMTETKVYTFDPIPYGTSIPSGEIHSRSEMTYYNSQQDVNMVNLRADFAKSTSEYFYLLIKQPDSAVYESSSNSGATVGYIEVKLLGLHYEGEGVELFNPTLAVSPTSVSTGGSFTATVDKRGGRACRIVIKYGNTQLSVTSASDTNSIQAPKSWFTTAGVTTLKSITLSVELQLDMGGGYITVSTKSITLNAGSNMNPVIGSATCSIVQPAPLSTNYPSTWVYNISKAKFSVNVTPGSNAAISSVVAKGAGSASVTLAYNSSTGKYEGTSGPLTTNYWQIEVTDQRGMKKTSSNIGPSTIYGYVAPAVTIDMNNTYRCTAAGVKDSSGTYFKAKASATIYQLPSNSVDILSVNGVRITPGTQSGAISTSATAGDTITLTFTATDRAGYSGTATITLKSGSSNIIIYARKDSSGEETRIGIGKVPMRTWQSGKTENLIDISIPSDSQKWNFGYFINEIPAGAFRAIVESNAGASFNKNFIDVDLTDSKAEKNAAAYFYKIKTDTNWTNLPSEIGSGGLWAGFRIVYPGGSHQVAMVVILEVNPVPGRVWFRRVQNNDTGLWKSLTPT